MMPCGSGTATTIAGGVACCCCCACVCAWAIVSMFVVGKFACESGGKEDRRQVLESTDDFLFCCG